MLRGTRLTVVALLVLGCLAGLTGAGFLFATMWREGTWNLVGDEVSVYKIQSHVWWDEKPSREKVEKLIRWYTHSKADSYAFVNKKGEFFEPDFGELGADFCLRFRVNSNRRTFYSREEAIERILAELDKQAFVQGKKG